jgi:hypothetical protein
MNKEFLVNQYMERLDMRNFSVKKIKEDLKRILHEEPAVELDYKIEENINETLKEVVKTEKISQIHLYFTETDDNTKKTTYIIE